MLSGRRGPAGPIGPKGDIGNDGLSAYEVWLANGNAGTVNDYLASLVGPQGPKGDTGDVGPAGADGRSAYGVWLDEGNVGTVDDYLASLVGPQGPAGSDADTTALEAELGANPSGVYATVQERLHSLITPSYHDLRGWLCPPEQAATSSGTLQAGILSITRIEIPEPGPLSKIWMQCTQAGSGATALANVFFGILDPDGDLIGRTSNAAGFFATTGLKSFTMNAEPGQSMDQPGGSHVFACGLVGTQSTTPMQIMRTAGGWGHININLTAASGRRRFMSYGSGLTAIPSSIPFAGTSEGGGGPHWFALS